MSETTAETTAEMTVSQPTVLKEKIAAAITDIKEGRSTPKTSGIGKMFSELMPLVDNQCYQELASEYKPIAAEYFKANPKEGMSKEQMVQREIQHMLAGYNKSDDDIYGDDEPKSRRSATKVKSVVDKVRTAKVRILSAPKVVKPKGNRDRSPFKFNGAEYGKGPLVRAVLTQYVNDNPGITHDAMKLVFPDALLRSYGIFKSVDIAREISKVRQRYFLKEEQLIQLSDCQIAVCNQFTSDNIVPFLEIAKRIGYSIEQ